LKVAALKKKIILGTVQLGLNYGINNKTGKPNEEEAFKILNEASKNQVSILDTAEAYGDSMTIIGNYFRNFTNTNFEVISKFIGDDDYQVHNRFESSLAQLNKKSLYAYMYHRFSDYLSGVNKSVLLRLREAGKIAKIGVSVYGLDELKVVVKDPDVTLVQIPYNVFDASKEKKELFEQAQQMGKEIHVRSIFLQGLLFKKPEELTGNLREFAATLRDFRTLILEYNLDVMQACLNHAIHNTAIDGVVIGVEKQSQLEQNLDALLPEFPIDLATKFESLIISNSVLLNPAAWKP
jgi:aryl-alcohol dehydrogenase-like predicted oxidoreductase